MGSWPPVNDGGNFPVGARATDMNHCTLRRWQNQQEKICCSSQITDVCAFS